MEHIKNLIPNQKQISKGYQNDYKPTLPSLNEKTITKLFSVLMIHYSHKWASQFPDDKHINAMKKVWGEALHSLSNNQIKQGLDLCIDEYPSWPPTLGEFKALCKVGEVRDLPPQLSPPSPMSSEKRIEFADYLSRSMK